MDQLVTGAAAIPPPGVRLHDLAEIGLRRLPLRDVEMVAPVLDVSDDEERHRRGVRVPGPRGLVRVAIHARTAREPRGGGDRYRPTVAGAHAVALARVRVRRYRMRTASSRAIG